jgi:hypothetical protein
MNDAGSLRQFGDCMGVAAADLRRAAARAVLGMLLAVAATVLWRRTAGALVRPLNPAALLLCIPLVVAVAAAIRIAWRPARRQWAAMLSISFAIGGMAFGLCLPGTPLIPLAMVLLCVAAEECWAWIGFFRRRKGIASCHIGATAGFSGNVAPRQETITAVQAVSGVPHFPAAEVVEQMSRRRAADGAEEIAGWLRVSFAAGQRTAAAHAAFCPPLGAMPELTFEQLDGPAARIKPGQVLPFGIRLDLKLAAAAEEPADVLLRFTARAKAE